MNEGLGVVCGVRVSHDAHDRETIEAARATDQTAAVEALLDAPAVREAYVLQTCHRVEAYVVVPAAPAGQRALATQYGDLGEQLAHTEALRHLLRVAAGLESVVLGEDQVLGQVRAARDDARRADGLGSVLGDAVTKAIHVGERARTETAINEGAVSMGSAAVGLAERDLDLEGRSALVVGAGEMGHLAAKALARSGAEGLTVLNRTPERAETVADDVACPATGRGLDALAGALATASVAVTATASPTPLLDRAALADAGETLLVDLGRPRDVAPEAAALPHVTVYDVDDIEDVTETTRAAREAAAEEVDALVEAELERLLAQFKRERADEVIAAMYEGAERVKERELSTALSRLDAAGDLDDEQREVVESLADSLVSQLLAAPTKSLRDAAAEDDWDTITTAIDLFDPAFDAAPTAPTDGSGPGAEGTAADDD